MNDKGSLVSDIVPNIESNHLNRLSLVSFLDRIEVGEDNALNFVFNNIETVNLLEAIVENSQSSDKAESSEKAISINRYYAHKLGMDISLDRIGGVC